MAGQVQLENSQFEVAEFDPAQFSSPQFYFIQSDGSDTQHSEYIVKDLGDLGDNAIIMFEEGGVVGAEEIVSSEEYVTYTVPASDLNNLVPNSEYDLLQNQYNGEITYQLGGTGIGNLIAKQEINDAVANIGAVECQEEEVQTHFKTDGELDVHYEIKKEIVQDESVSLNKVFFSSGQSFGAEQSYKVDQGIKRSPKLTPEQPLNLVKKEKVLPSSSIFNGNSDLVICKLCNCYVVGSKIDIHNRDVHSNVDRLNCPDCGKLFTSKRSLVGHKKEKHSGQLEIFPCGECGKNFSRKSNLKAHMDSIHFGKKFPCSFCERIFTNRSCMNLHVKKAHSDILMSL